MKIRMPLSWVSLALLCAVVAPQWTGAAVPALVLPSPAVELSVSNGFTDATFHTKLAGVPAPPPNYSVSNSPSHLLGYLTWCVDQPDGITNGTLYPAYLFSSYDPALPLWLQSPDWDRVNYIINHKIGTKNDVQFAITHYIGSDPRVSGRPLSANSSNMVWQADTYGTGFVPGQGQRVAVVADPGTGVQVLAIEVLVPVYQAPPAGALSGFVYVDTDSSGARSSGDAPLAGITVTLSGTDDQGRPVSLQTTTASDGSYHFTELPLSGPLGYTVSEGPTPGYLQGPVTPGSLGGVTGPGVDMISGIVVAAGNLGTDYNFGELAPVRLGDYVWVDGNGNGIQESDEAGLNGVRVRLLDGAGVPVRDALGSPVETLTATGGPLAAAGYYLFGMLPPGTYQVQFDAPSGWGFTAPLKGTDRAADSDASPADGKTAPVALLTFGASDLTLDAGVYPLSSLSGFVYVDAGNDGIRGASETVLPGVTVTLAGLDGAGNPVTRSVVTDDAGFYLFAGLAPGVYTVTETQPAGWLDGKDTQGTPGTGVTGNDQFSTILLAAGVNGTENNFGEIPLLTLACAGSSGQVNVPYTGAMVADGGVPPYTFSITSGALPAGLVLDAAAGVISGTPTAEGLHSFTVQVTDSAGAAAHTVAASCGITLIPAVSLVCAGAPGEQNVPYMAQLTAAGGTAPYAFSIASGTLPPGLVLNPDGSITGIPLAAGDFPFTAAVVDATGVTGGHAASANCGVTLAPALGLVCAPVSGEVNVALTMPLTVSGGQSPYTFTILSGSLPAGLVLDSATGIISGTPTAAGTFTYVAQVTDSLGGKATTAASACGITVAPALGLVCAPVSGEANVALTMPLTVSGGQSPYTFTILSGSLPAGLALDSATGIISGTPTAAGTFTYVAQVTDSLGGKATTTASSCGITVAPALGLVCAPVSGEVNVVLTMPLTVSGGQSPYTFTILSGSLPAGLALDSATGIISGTPTAAGTFTYVAQVTDSLGGKATTTASSCGITVAPALGLVCAPVSGEVNVVLTMPLTVSGGQSPYTFTILSGSLPAGLALDSATGIISGTPTAAGTFTYVAQVTDSLGGKATTTASSCGITVAPALGLVCAPVSGEVNLALTMPLTVSGGQSPYTFTILSGSLPAGLSLDSATGIISGTPTAAGTFTYVAQVTDALGGKATTAASSCGITVAPALGLVCAPVSGEVNVALTMPLTVSGGKSPYTFTILSGSLPAGLALDSATGIISGTPTAAGTFTYVAQVTDSLGGKATTAGSSCGITVAPALGLVCAPVSGEVNVALTMPLTVSGGQSPYTFTILSGSLPAGLALDSATGIISGTPTAAGTFTYVAQVTDSLGGKATTAASSCGITVAPALGLVCAPVSGQVNVALTTPLTVSGGKAPYTFAIISGSLPAGLTLAAGTGIISGTPTAAGTFTYVAQVTDSLGGKATTAASACGITISSECIPSTFAFSGSSAVDGTDGNSRVFTANGMSVRASAFSRTKSGAVWAPAYVGIYGGGLGVTDSGEGDGSGNAHTVDNIDRDNFVLFEFSQPVVLNRAYLGYVVSDSDISLWIGNFNDPYRNHLTLSDSVLGSFSYSEDNYADSAATRWADVNAGQVTGNAIVIAAWTGDTTAEDQFKIAMLDLCQPAAPLVLACADSAAQTGAPYASVLLASGGVPPYSFSISSGRLPAGLALDAATGIISGTPSEAGTFAYAAQVRDSKGQTAAAPGGSCSITVKATCVPTTFAFSGSSGMNGTDGNSRVFTTNGISVRVSAFSRTKCNPVWAAAYLGSYSGGLGVTDSGEGDGSGNAHTVDNIDRDNFVLFEFSQPVVLNRAYLGYVVSDSDISLWIGTFNDPYRNHLTLSDSVLGSFSYSEDNYTDSSATRWAAVNSGQVMGNAIVIAAWTGDTTAEDQFKISKLDLCQPAEPLTLVATGLDVNCNGASDGAISAVFAGGTPPYTLSLDGAAFAAAVSPATFDGLPAGEHSVTVKDARGATASKTVIILQPAAVTLTLTKTDASCKCLDGSVTAVFGGGTGPYSVSIDGGAFVAAVSPKTFAGLAAGPHTVRVADAHSCSVCLSVTVNNSTTAPALACPPDAIVPAGSAQDQVYCGYTQGGWGAPPKGCNPGMLLRNNFAAVYPAGIEVGIPGTGGFSMKFTCAKAIENYLPAGGTPGALCADASNPGATASGVFGGQVLALQLNVDFSRAGVPAAATGPLGVLVLNDPASPLHGKTVSQILALANTALGGGNAGVGMADLNALVTALNEAFDNCIASEWASDHLTPPWQQPDISPAKTGYATATVKCGTAPLVSWTDTTAPADCAGGSVITRTWTAVDTCGNRSACTQIIRVGCQPSPLVLGCVPVSAGEAGLGYSSALAASGGTPPYTFSVRSGSLPPGLALDPATGVIWGVPSTAGTFAFSAKVVDSAAGAAQTATVNCGIVIAPVQSQGCTLTIGYYKNHPSAISPLPVCLGASGGSKTLVVSSQQIGVNVLGQHCYGAPPNGITKLYAQLLAAKLNGLRGAALKAVSPVISSADAFLAGHDHTDWSCLTAAEQTSVLSWHSALDDYNNGITGPGHCGDTECSRAQVVKATPGNCQVTLSWLASREATSYKVLRCFSPGGSFTAVATVTGTSYTDKSAPNGTPCYYAVSAMKAGVDDTESDEAWAVAAAALPSPWQTKDIGAVVATGGCSGSNSKIALAGSGADIWGGADAFRYVYQLASGDCSIVAKVTALGNTDPWAKAGVMIRETLNADARHASGFLTPDNGAAFQYRCATGGASGNVNTAALPAPCWLKLVRTGSVFTCYRSADGTKWTAIGSQSVSMGSSVYIGLAVTSHAEGELCGATIENVTATP